MKVINNQDTLLIEEAKSLITAESNIYLACQFFTSFALFELFKAFTQSKQVKVLLDINEKHFEDFKLIQNGNEKKLNLSLDRKYKINQVISLIEFKVEIRKGRVSNQNVLIIENNGTSTYFLITPENFDVPTLGLIPSETSILINAKEDTDNQYLTYFNNAWENSKQSLNDLVIQYLQKGVQNYTAESIYKYSVKEIFHYSTISERADEKLQKVGFKETKIWSLLYNFQKDAVIGAIEKIETYGGCIIADSVGLGKTFEALAVMQYYQLRNHRILVLAPKKLRENWTVYRMNDKRNILMQDRFNYDVLNHSDLSREKGKSGDIDLETINWGNYDLVVIDESHNFRNNNPSLRTVTRYQKLLNDVIRANIRTKVLMLSATPVNNRMNDLKNQIAFITEGNDHAFSPEIDSISQVMRDSQSRFNQWYNSSDPDNLNVHELMELLDGSYFRILDMLTIARSRKHIEKYYDTKDIGKFPYRRQPITITPAIDTRDQFTDIEQLYDQISTLTLAAYTPLGYVLPERKPEYSERYDRETRTGSVFRQVDREQSLISLMRVNLLKRLESSIHSFRLTIEKLVEFIDHNLKQIEKHQNGDLDTDYSINDIDIDDVELEDMLVGGRIKILIQDIDLIRWKQNLKYDRQILVKVLGNIKLIDVTRDAKLLELRNVIEAKLTSPINGENKKVIVFTAFADTADYLYKQLVDWLKNKQGVYSALITGSGTNKTNMPGGASELNAILTHFSPRSKKRNEIYPDEENQIDVLFCTDCISEGQNLQDCDFLINYDIHWNPVRIIQRFGRIDRIGSINESIQLVNFFPSMELDSFIDLVGRVQQRMVMLDVSATGEENIINGNAREMQDLEYRRRQLKQLKDQVLDLEDVQGTISITDLTFNDFKIDLEKSTDSELEELKLMPPASYAVVNSNLEQVKEGVIFCLKDTSDEHQGKLRKNILHPFFLVYMSLDGTETVKATQAKTALDYFRKLCMGNDKVLTELVAQFDKETKGNKKMEAYAKLLKTAIGEVVGVKEEAGLDSLASPGGTLMFSDALEQEENIELVSFLIIK